MSLLRGLGWLLVIGWLVAWLPTVIAFVVIQIAGR